VSAVGHVPGTRIVRASKLPPVVRLPSLYHAAGPALVEQCGRKVRITFLGHTVVLSRSARVRVVAS